MKKIVIVLLLLAVVSAFAFGQFAVGAKAGSISATPAGKTTPT